MRGKSFQGNGDSREKTAPPVLCPFLALSSSSGDLLRIWASLLASATPLTSKLSQGMKNPAREQILAPDDLGNILLLCVIPIFFLCRSSEGQFQALGLLLRAPPVLRALSLFPGSALGWPQPTGRDAFIPISSQPITALSTNTFPRKQLLLGAGSAWDPVTPDCHLILTSAPAEVWDSFHAKIQASALQLLFWSHHSFPEVCSPSCSAPAPSWLKSRPLQLEASAD